MWLSEPDHTLFLRTFFFFSSLSFLCSVERLESQSSDAMDTGDSAGIEKNAPSKFIDLRKHVESLVETTNAAIRGGER